MEGISALVLVLINPNASGTPKFNRTLSGYTVFRNTPNFVENATKENPGDKDLKTDRYGFICDEEITQHKDSGVVRIFLMGGSAAISAGQTQTGDCYSSVKWFPPLIYNYNISIAGYLKKYLQAKFPGRKIQVVNGACYNWQLHQSMLAYLSAVNQFNPDIIINMDGFNDVASVCSGSAYELTENSNLGPFADLKNATASWIFKSKTAKLIYYLFMKWMDPATGKHGKTSARLPESKVLLASAGNETGKNGIPHGCVSTTDTTVYNFAKYQQIKPKLIKFSGAWLRVLDEYSNTLRDDSVKFLFVMQPILQRGTNKHLAAYETEMQQINSFGFLTPHVNPGFGTGGDPRLDFTAVNAMGEKDGVTYLARRYFFDDFLSDTVKGMAMKKGFAYCDMSYEIQSLGSDFDFYTDYCHLTKQGYQFVGERMGKMIVEQGWIK